MSSNMAEPRDDLESARPDLPGGGEPPLEGGRWAVIRLAFWGGGVLLTLLAALFAASLLSRGAKRVLDRPEAPPPVVVTIPEPPPVATPAPVLIVPAEEQSPAVEIEPVAPAPAPDPDRPRVRRMH